MKDKEVCDINTFKCSITQIVIYSKYSGGRKHLLGPLFLIGAALVFSFIGAVVMKRLGIPQILGFMLAGIFLGLFGVFTDETWSNLFPLVDLALGLIGYNIGLEIRKDVFSGKIRQMSTILILESIMTFIIVTLLANWILGQWHLAIVFGALASATDPASTVMVIWERHCKGDLTDTLMFVLALDDVVAIVLANISISLAIMYYAAPGTVVLLDIGLFIFYDIGVSALIGGILGVAMVVFINRENDRSRLLELELGMIVLLVGIMVWLEISSILACMVFGFVVGNYVKPEKDPINHTLKTVMSPIVMFFFVYVGASIDLTYIVGGVVIILVIVYVLGRSTAKYAGAYIGGHITNTPFLTKKYLGSCLMSQAGVAVGLALVIEGYFSELGSEAVAAGALILNVVALTTMILQVFGPLFASIGLRRAGEYPDDLDVDLSDCVETTLPEDAKNVGSKSYSEIDDFEV